MMRGWIEPELEPQGFSGWGIDELAVRRGFSLLEATLRISVAGGGGPMQWPEQEYVWQAEVEFQEGSASQVLAQLLAVQLMSSIRSKAIEVHGRTLGPAPAWIQVDIF